MDLLTGFVLLAIVGGLLLTAAIVASIFFWMKERRAAKLTLNHPFYGPYRGEILSSLNEDQIINEQFSFRDNSYEACFRRLMLRRRFIASPLGQAYAKERAELRGEANLKANVERALSQPEMVVKYHYLFGLCVGRTERRLK